MAKQPRDRATGRFTKTNPEPVTNSSNGSNNGNVVMNETLFYELTYNALLRRMDLLKGTSFDTRRDIDDECGYPNTNQITVQDYRDMYDREAIAARVVECLPRESWAVEPTVFEDEDSDNITEFEQAFADLGKNLRGKSWYQDQESSPIWEYLQRADERSGIGWFGGILFGIDDGEDLRAPVESVERAVLTNNQDVPKNGVERNLLFLRVFDESLIEVTHWENKESSPRYGQPTEYNITFADPNDILHGGSGVNRANAPVHWTRFLHLADNLGSSEIFGTPRQQPVWNRLYDLRKVYGGCGEMYWRGALPGISLETHPQLGGNVSLNRSELRSEMEQYMNGLQRYMMLKGMTANSLAPQVVDPSPQVDVLLTAICIKMGIPKRIFMGSERGQLASGQDDATWNDRLAFRHNRYLTPRMVVPFVDRAIQLHILPEPKGYSCVWPDLNALTDLEKADIAVKRTEALTKYVAGSVESIVAPMDFLTRIIGFDQDEAQAIVEAAVEVMPEDRITIPEQPQPQEGTVPPEQSSQPQEGNPQEPVVTEEG